MIPPPSTSSRSGTPSSSRAPVESITRGSSCGTKGSVTASDPAAMIAWSKLTVVVEPSEAVTSTWFIEVNRPVPVTVVTLRCLASPVSPPVSRCLLPRLQIEDGATRGDRVADADLERRHGARRRSGDVHGGLVGLEGDQRVLRRHGVARCDVHLDHRHVVEAADVGDRDLDLV